MCQTEHSVQNDIKKISELITLYSDRLGLSTYATALDIYASWTAIVGEKQAAHSKLIDIKHQTAIIETDHPGWSQQILLNKRHIIRNFQKKYPQLEVKDISVMVSPPQSEEKHYRSVVSTAAHHIDKKICINTKALHHQDKTADAPSSTQAKPNVPSELQNLLERLGKTIAENERK